jgi:predicted KAP-like P-loop ATPase
MKTDSTVKNKNQDLLERYSFAQKLVKGLLDNFENGQDSIVVGLNGEWGTGKSSLLEFVKNEIFIQTYDKPYRNLTYEFNPWRITSQEDLQHQFLTGLGQMLGNYNKEYEKLKNDFLKISEVASSVNSLNPEPTSKLTIKALTKVSTLLIKRKTIEQYKKEVDERLEDNNIKLFIIIDDIDRLSPAEIIEVFQLIKLNANFKNTYFLIAFDKKIVIDGLSERYKSQSEKYLEKIIQIDYTVPLISQESIFKIFKKELSSVFKKIEIEFNDELFQNIWSKYLRFYFTTIRHIYRFFNSLEIRLPVISNDVNPYDFILIEIIRIFDFNAYEWIIRHKDNLTFRRISRFSSFLQSMDNNKKSINESISKLINDDIELKSANKKTREIILDLFSLNDFDSYFTNEENINKNKKVVSNDYFNHYFSFVISSSNIPDIDLHKYINENKDSRLEILTFYLGKDLINKFLKRLVYKIEYLEDKPDCETLISQLIEFSDNKLKSILFKDINQNGWGIIYNGIIEIAQIYQAQNGFKTLIDCITLESISNTRFQILNNLVFEIYKKNNIHLSLIPAEILTSNSNIIHEKFKFQLLEIAKLLMQDKFELSYFELRGFFFILKTISDEEYGHLLSIYTESIEKTILLFRYSLSSYSITGQDGPGFALIENNWIIPEMTIAKFDQILSNGELSKFTEENYDYLNLFFNLRKEGFKKDVYFRLNGEQVEMI